MHVQNFKWFHFFCIFLVIFLCAFHSVLSLLTTPHINHHIPFSDFISKIIYLKRVVDGTSRNLQTNSFPASPSSRSSTRIEACYVRYYRYRQVHIQNNFLNIEAPLKCIGLWVVPKPSQRSFVLLLFDAQSVSTLNIKRAEMVNTVLLVEFVILGRDSQPPSSFICMDFL